MRKSQTQEFPGFPGERSRRRDPRELLLCGQCTILYRVTRFESPTTPWCAILQLQASSKARPASVISNHTKRFHFGTERQMFRHISRAAKAFTLLDKITTEPPLPAKKGELPPE